MGRFSSGRLILGGIVTVALFGIASYLRPIRRANEPAQDANRPSDSTLLKLTLEIEAKEKRADASVWALETAAAKYDEFVAEFWNALNSSEDTLELFASQPTLQIELPTLGPTNHLGHAIEQRQFSSKEIVLDYTMRKAWIEQWKREGFRITQSEWRHIKFNPETDESPAISVVSATAHVVDVAGQRSKISAELEIGWARGASAGEARPRTVRLSRLEILSRRGEPVFRRVSVQRVAPPARSFFIDPLIVYDLDGDGHAEIILAARNLVFRLNVEGQFTADSLCAIDPGLIFSGIVGDFNGDGIPDFLCVDRTGLLFYSGNRQGRFPNAPVRVWSAPARLEYVQQLTCGDANADGSLDLWLAQYKPPYTAGQMATPFYDAKDGFPSYLLINDGHGNFHDVTGTSGLASKRFRRTYSSSFVDLNDDGALDLVVVSDFAGIDTYLNDGKGHFRDVTADLIDEPHLLGMAHVFGDFNRDGSLDILAIGMNSPIADRLNHLGIGRPGYPEYQRMLPRMTEGNRLYLGGNGKFRQAPFNTTVARTGWSWGATALDFDNDGYQDLYIVNGHSSNQSVRDYEPQFWTHDIYVGNSTNNPAADLYFKSASAGTRGRGWSYGGYEKNRLLMNQSGKSFVETGYLMGVAMEEDCRNVVSEDLNGDGKMDLLVTTFEVWPERKQTLHIFKNQCPDAGNWIGFRFRDADGFSPIGTRVTIHSAGHKQIRVLVTGDSHRSQHSNSAHFGLGMEERVESVEFRWPNGKTNTFQNPEINRYHDVRPE